MSSREPDSICGAPAIRSSIPPDKMPNVARAASAGTAHRQVSPAQRGGRGGARAAPGREGCRRP